MHTTDRLSIHHVQVGDTLTPPMVDFKRPDGTRVDVAGKTIGFELYDEDGDDIATGGTTTFEEYTFPEGHPEAGTTITVGQHDFSDAEVETPGIYYMYFTLTESTEVETFPAREGMLRLHVNARRT